VSSPFPGASAVIAIDKQAGITSHDVVARVRRALRPEKPKVGHAGTLDPDATGLLLVCVGGATRLAELLADRGKSYDARMQFGVTTDSLDSSGTVVSTRSAAHLTRQMVEDALDPFRGDILQIPPMVSAVHHDGRRLYELAREGREVERTARPARIDALTLLDFAPGERAARGRTSARCAPISAKPWVSAPI
jgi:tRNA pseudouridine55 synthase